MGKDGDKGGNQPLKGWQLSVEAPSQGLHSSAFLVHKALSRSALDARKQLEASLALAQSHALSAWETRASPHTQGFVQGLQELAQRLPAVTIPGTANFGGALRVIDDPLSRSLRSFRAGTGKELAERGEKADKRSGDGLRLHQKIGGGEWDILKSLDKNLRTLEKAFIEGAAEHERRVRAAARKRAKMEMFGDGASREDKVLGLPKTPFVLSEGLPDVGQTMKTAFSNFHRHVEKHLPKPPDAGAIVSEFVKNTQLRLPRVPTWERQFNSDADGEQSDASTSGRRLDPIVPWQILVPKVPWTLTAPAKEDREEGPFQKAVKKRRRALEEKQAAIKAARQQGPEGRRVRDPGRSIAVVTTASLPWMTGTSVNPALRAAYLARDGTRKVTLLLPWLAPSDQQLVHPGTTFTSPTEQATYVRNWVESRVGFSPDMKVTFYPGRWAPDKRSILPVGDITQYVPDSEADVAVLEEPEHLTWYHHGVRWTDKFRHVVGVVHTNYLEYARREENGEMKEKILRFINNWVVRSYCHKVVKLSDAVQDLPRSQTCFIHGVSPKFLQIGEQKAKRLEAAAAKQAAKQQQQASSSSSSSPAPAPASGSSHHPHAHSAAFSKGVYFIGKVVWGKGYTELLDLVEKHRAAGGSELEVDVYGGGDDLGEVQRSAKDRRLPLHFHGPKDHADGALQGYKVFVNPSLSDVVATTTAEALAMGKWVVVAEHPSNAFFTGRFRNCLTYRTPEEFSRHIAHAVATDPAPLNEEEKHALTWEAATERFMEVADKVPSRKGQWREGLVDWAASQLHNTLTGVEPLRGLAGAGPNTKHAPEDLETWRPCKWTGGALDRKA